VKPHTFHDVPVDVRIGLFSFGFDGDNSSIEINRPT
jgi:hypothetical protein